MNDSGKKGTEYKTIPEFTEDSEETERREIVAIIHQLEQLDAPIAAQIEIGHATHRLERALDALEGGEG